MFAVNIQNEDYTNKTYFQIKLFQRFYRNYDNGTNDRSQKIEIFLEPCTYEHFHIFD